jgi:serine/threonine protein phosphatase 1
MPAPEMRRKLFSHERPDIIYAIGDVHGCFDLLQALQQKILNDAAQQHGSKWIVMLGDYIDRGPKSSYVLHELMQPMSGDIERFCLAGNHEATMLDFLEDPRKDHLWLEFGGLETLKSYGIGEIPQDKKHLKALLKEHIPQNHIDFMASLPSLLAVPGLCFVHAGVVNGVPLQRQHDKHLLWIRPKEQTVPGADNLFMTVHGHTPVRSVSLSDNRLNVDTGAFMTGRLSAVKIVRDGTVTVMHAE